MIKVIFQLLIQKHSKLRPCLFPNKQEHITSLASNSIPRKSLSVLYYVYDSVNSARAGKIFALSAFVSP